MSRNRIKSRIEKKTLKTKKDDINKKNLLNDTREYNKTIHNKIHNESQDDTILEVNNTESCSEFQVNKIPAVSGSNEAVSTLKNIVYLMQKSDSPQSKHDKFNVNAIDPNFDFRFLNRKSTHNIFLPPIKTRLEWQIGEFPFFKIDARYYNHDKVAYKNKRRKNRRIKVISVQNIATNQYYDMEYPTEIWPCKGIIYITNLRLFFKRTKQNSFYITFDNILSYSFYNNAVVIEYLQYEEKIIDVFYVDSEQARLLETIIQITL